ncbi:hypothetical protein C1645_734391 [Glomus cerebriforme]|uniref:Uncharacterized protein n=1 Tax=Glomus cerebriforme TaxID=658196 RepID=A0A397TJ46_9GLOM|nr:hypothetical protein C1645_734391 [Glomus cerebriforme]
MYIMSRKELYTESEIKEFEKSIINWCTDFKSIFAPLSLTECRFPKLHSWCYHAALDIFLDTSSQDSESSDFYIKIYESVHLENGKILRTSREFQGKEWFSNVAVTPAEDQEIQYGSDEDAWYGKRKSKKIW